MAPAIQTTSTMAGSSERWRKRTTGLNSFVVARQGLCHNPRIPRTMRGGAESGNRL